MFKNFKKIGILLILVLFCFSVTAQNLNNFPKQFVKNEKFDGKIVLGSIGSARDYLSAVEVGIGLQYNLGQSDSDSVSETITEDTVDATEVFQIRKGTNFLESVEPMSEVIPIITGDDFDFLASGEIRNKFGTYGYKQFLTLGPSGSINYGHQTEIPEDPDEIPVTSLQFEAGADVYEYKLSFATPLKTEIASSANGYDLKDLNGKKITILGREYNIFSTSHPAADSISITLIGGSREEMITGHQIKNYTVDGENFVIEIMGLYNRGSELKAILKINDEMTKDLGMGDTYTLSDGVDIAIKDLVKNEATEKGGGDIVMFVLGAKKITLTDEDITDDNYNTDPYKVAGREVPNTYVKIKGTDDGLVEGGEIKIDEIYVKFTPEDKHFVAANKGLLDIVENKNQLFAGSFDIYYNSYKEAGNDMETLDLVYNYKSEYILEFSNKLDQHLQIPLFYVNSGAITRFGGEDYALIVEENVNISKGMYFIVTSDGYNQLPNAKGTTHYIKYLGQDAEANKIKFKDMGKDLEMTISYKDGDTSKSLLLNNVFYEFTFTDVEDGNILVDLNNDGTIKTGDKPTLVTKYGMNIDLETWPYSGYAYKRFTVSSTKKQSSVAGATLNGVLHSTIGPSVQAGYNASPPAGFGMGIASNPVLDSAAVTTFHDGVRVAVKADGDNIEIDSIQRCIDMMNPKHITDSVTTVYDAVVAGTHAAYPTLVRYPTLGENILEAFMENACYPEFTVNNQFLWDVGDSNVQTGSTSFGQLIQYTKEKSGPDLFSMISAKNQLEHLVYLKSSDSEVSSVSVQNTNGKLAINSKISSALLDTDLDNSQENLVLVGGPCVNTVTKELLGNPSDCTAGFEEGKGRIKFVEKNGFNYVIVAGYSGEDTFRAAKVLSEFDKHDFPSDDLMISGTLVSPIIEKYVEPVKAQPTKPEPKPTTPAPEKKEEVVEEVVEETLNCPGTQNENIAYDVEIKKFGITKDVSTSASITVEGLTGTVTYPGSEPFEAQMGVDWLQYTMHILRDDCEGDEIATLVFKWEDGDLGKTETFTLPEKGCYCAKVTSTDLEIDSASIEMVGKTQATADFSAN